MTQDKKEKVETEAKAADAMMTAALDGLASESESSSPSSGGKQGGKRRRSDQDSLLESAACLSSPCFIHSSLRLYSVEKKARLELSQKEADARVAIEQRQLELREKEMQAQRELREKELQLKERSLEIKAEAERNRHDEQMKMFQLLLDKSK